MQVVDFLYAGLYFDTDLKAAGLLILNVVCVSCTPRVFQMP